MDVSLHLLYYNFLLGKNNNYENYSRGGDITAAV